MRKAKRSGSFFLCLLFNILLNLDGLIPSAVLLAVHFWLNISVMWSVGAAAIWLGWIILYMLVIGWANDCGNTPDKTKENKNPYSVKK